MFYKQLQKQLKLSGRSMRMCAMLALMMAGGGNFAHAQMSGTYTVCSSGCDFSTIQEAADNLMKQGVDGAVTIDIAPGTYKETVQMYQQPDGIKYAGQVVFKGAGRSTMITTGNSNAIFLSEVGGIAFQDMIVESTDTRNAITIQTQYCKELSFDNIEARAPISSGKGNGYVIYDEYSYGLSYSNMIVRGGFYGVMMYNDYYNNSEISFTDSRFTQSLYTLTYFSNLNGLKMDRCYLDSTSQNYGMATYFEYCNGLNITNCTIPMYNCSTGLYGYDYNGSNEDFVFINNMVGNTSGLDMDFAMYFDIYYSYSNITLQHNTIVFGGRYQNYASYLYLYGFSGEIDVRNNIFHSIVSGSYPAYWYDFPAGSKSRIEDNVFYEPNQTRAINFAGMDYSVADWNSYKSAVGIVGTPDFGLSTDFVSATDMHVDKTKGTQYGKAIKGIEEDVDGDKRCLNFPTVGADENPYGKTSAKVDFFIPSTVYEGYPTTLTNIAKFDEPRSHKWYVDQGNGNGFIFASDSVHLLTTKLSGSDVRVKLVTTSCQGKDSIIKKVTITKPTAKPVTDFTADKNTINSGEVVTFTDLSLNGPSAWQWAITPIDQQVGSSTIPRYKVVYGDMKSYKMQVKFLVGGKYKVCLTTANSIGSGNQECKVDYIDVMPNFLMGVDKVINSDARGNIYDDGGPNGNYSSQSNYTFTQTMLIDPCADSVFLIIKKFDVYDGYAFLRIFEGKDNTGTPLHKRPGNDCTMNGNGYAGGGPGFTGGTYTTSSYRCMPNKYGIDTFKAKKSMFIEFTPGYNYQSPGFEMYYWTTPRTQPKPTAGFKSADTVCTNGFVTFTNTAKGDDIRYLWDLDGDMDFFEYTGSTSTSWPFFFPGNYIVTQIATNCGGSDTFQKVITVINPNKPVAAFTADNTNPATTDVVFLKSDVVACVDNYSWNIYKTYGGTRPYTFVGGTSKVAAAPQVLFNDTGYYTVVLKVTNISGTDSIVKKAYIKVKDAYCRPVVANVVADMGISKVVLSHDGETIFSNSSTQGVSEYQNFTSTVSGTVELGVTYTIDVERNSNFNSIHRSVFVDWNGDGDFTDAGEEITETPGKNKAWTTTFTVPVNAKVGATVMRVASNNGLYSNKPCGQNEFGEYEDYRLYVSTDITRPVITLKGKDTVRFEQGESYTDSGVVAMDNLDGDITSKVVLSSTPKFNVAIPGTYVFSYDVADAAGNKAKTVKRVVIIGKDVTPPVLTVQGTEQDTVFVAVNKPYNKIKVISAMDAVDGDITASVSSTDLVMTNKPGIFTNTYTSCDMSGNCATQTRIVAVIDTVAPTMFLKGNAVDTIEVFSTWNDAGVNAVDEFYSGYQKGDVEARVQMTTNLDNTKLGTYTAVYTLEDPSGNKAQEITRTIVVADRTAPIVKLNGNTTEEVNIGERYHEEGLSIFDNLDKDITTWDTAGTYYATFGTGSTTALGNYTIIYTVKDKSGNKTSITRTINVVDHESPVIELKGDVAVNVCRWTHYTDALYTVSDNAPGKITVTAEGNFLADSTSKPGLYYLRYKAVDASGNIAYSDARIITVVQPDDVAFNCTTGIATDKDLANAINVYPNPNDGRFNLRVALPSAERVTIKVINTLGEVITVVSNGVAAQSNYDVDLSTQRAGVYFVQVITSNGQVTKRVVVNR